MDGKRGPNGRMHALNRVNNGGKRVYLFTTQLHTIIIVQIDLLISFIVHVKYGKFCVCFFFN